MCPLTDVFLCKFFTIYHQARIYKTCSVLPAPVTAVKRAFGIWCLYVLLHLCNCVFFCMLETRRQHWPLGDRRSNKDVWLLQNPSAGIFLLSFTPSLGSQHTSSYFLKNTQAHAVTLLYPLQLVIAFSQCWQIIRRVLGIHSSHDLSIILTPETEVIYLFNFFTSLFSCLNSDLNRVCASFLCCLVGRQILPFLKILNAYELFCRKVKAISWQMWSFWAFT